MITRFTQPSGMTPSRYAEELLKKTLRSGVVYRKYALNKIFVDDLDVSIRYSMRKYWGGKRDPKLHPLALYATSLLRLQGHEISSKGINSSVDKRQTQRGKPLFSYKSGVNDVQSGSTFGFPASTKKSRVRQY